MAKKKETAPAAEAPVTETTAAEATTETAAEAKPAVVKVKQEERNGVVHPKAGTACGKVWEVADQLTAKLGHVAERKDVMEVVTQRGINPSTCATQYARWRKFHGYAAIRHSVPTAEEREKGLKGKVVEPEAAPMVVTEASPAAPEAPAPAPVPEVAEAPGEAPIPAPAMEAPVAMCAPNQ